jgi:hypothetical protein
VSRASASSGIIAPVLRPPRAFDYDSVLFSGIALVVTASRLPFISDSCGSDPDAWRIVAAAHNLAAFFDYSVSRFPGFPVVEIAYAPFAGHPVWMTTLTAIWSGIAAGALAVTMRSLGLRGAALAALAFAATPVVYVESTSTMDYVWSIALVLLGFMALVKTRAVLAGIAFGLAAGCRASALLMLAPACAFVVSTLDARDPKQAARRLAPTIACALLVTTVCYLPPWLRYGQGMLRYYPHEVANRVAVRLATLDVWGALGLCALGLAAALALMHLKRARRDGSAPWSDTKQRAAFITASTAVLCVSALYAWAPYEAGYLIPAVPFVIIAIAVLVPPRAARAVYALLLLSPFVHVSLAGMSEGLVRTDLREKLRYAEESKAILAQGRKLRRTSLIRTERRFPAVVVLLSRERTQPPLPDETMDAHAVTDASTTYMGRGRSLPERVQGVPIELVDVYDVRVAEHTVRLARAPSPSP